MTHSFAVVVELALRQVGLEHGRHGLLDLEEERVVLIAAHHQRHVAARSDAPDADDLVRPVDELIAIEQATATRPRACSV